MNYFWIHLSVSQLVSYFEESFRKPQISSNQFKSSKLFIMLMSKNQFSQWIVFKQNTIILTIDDSRYQFSPMKTVFPDNYPFIFYVKILNIFVLSKQIDLLHSNVFFSIFQSLNRKYGPITPD